ncbi:excalibur calcium-binding domain-containing protein [Mycobacterium sp. CSUR Q5927]|nr:excalibur calcium-binding domain-containing protein [Mycobacterium sp. CSUR Q5927]
MIRALLVALAFSAGLPTLTIPSTPAAHAEVPYRNCTEARANGDCDIPATSDKYQSKLDRDGDGIGCEC